MFDVLDSLKPHAHWLLRIGLASVFIFHGIGKAMALGGFAQMMGLLACPSSVPPVSRNPNIATGPIMTGLAKASHSVFP